MKNLMDNRLFCIAISVILAVALFFYANGIPSTTIQDHRYGGIPITYQNIPEDLVAQNAPSTVDVRVAGTSGALSDISSKDIKAYVDFAGATVGEGTYKIHVVVPSGIELKSFSPQTVAITLGEKSVKRVPLTVKATGNVAEGYGSVTPYTTVSTIEVSGPQNVLDTIDSAYISVDMEGLAQDTTKTCTVILADSEGNTIDLSLLTLNHPTVDAFISVSENKTSKSVAVKVNVFGELDKEYRTAGFEVYPASVKITGDYEYIKNIEFLETEPIDITGLKENTILNSRLVQPEGITLLDAGELQVVVNIEDNFTYKTFSNLTIEVVNPPDNGVEYVPYPTTATLTVGAYPWVIEEKGGMDQIQVRLYVDLEGQDPKNKVFPVLTEIEEGYSQISLDITEVSLVS